ncbi:MAG TPA: tryptophan synthase subunit alpha [Chthoniobacterales bacterium]|nr:tryptophan synthase subunit alpha [Chthoniobacterales bacterium]
MPNRIDECFQVLRADNEKAFIAYICAGDPDFPRTVDLAFALEKAGVDILEVGIPFSDPLADGLVNQLAAQRALEAGATVQGVLDCVGQIRQRSQIPIVLYSYLNPIFQFGFEHFHRQADQAGVDGLLILDLPPEEVSRAVAAPLSRGVTRTATERRGYSMNLEMPKDGPIHVRLIAPTTPPDRIERICSGAAGFIYYVSREGVTGVQSNVASSLRERVGEIRRHTKLPIAVGFGISTPEQAREVASLADAVVVGSAIVQKISEHATKPDLAARIGQFVEPLAAASKGH